MNYSARVTEVIPHYSAKLRTEDVRYIADTSNMQVITRTGGEVYDGEYNVKPNFELQILETNRKVMEDDVTVQAIEVSRVSNLSGGNTIYIGGIINA